MLVTIGTPETKESFERGKDKSREWLRGRNGVRAKRETREERKTEKGNARQGDMDGRVCRGWLMEPFVFYLRVSPPKSGWKNGVKG